MQTSFGTAQNLRLARTARVAGEAFAFNEPETVKTPNRFYGTVLFGLALAAVVAGSLYAFI